MNIKEQLKQIIDTLPDDKLKKVFEELQPTDKYKVKEASDFMYNVCKEMTFKITSEKKVTYYNKEKMTIFIQDFKNGYLDTSNYIIWEHLETIFGDSYNVISDFIKNWVETNLNWNGLTPRDTL